MIRTRHRIHDAFLRFCQSKLGGTAFPNVYIDGFEADVCRIDDSGMFVEYEIKIALSDYKIDFLKRRFVGNFDESTTYIKHDQIKGGLRCNKFFFVTPFGLVGITNVPVYCGLIYYIKDSFMVIKDAPTITNASLVDKLSKYQNL